MGRQFRYTTKLKKKNAYKKRKKKRDQAAARKGKAKE